MSNFTVKHSGSINDGYCNDISLMKFENAEGTKISISLPNSNFFYFTSTSWQSDSEGKFHASKSADIEATYVLNFDNMLESKLEKWDYTKDNANNLYFTYSLHNNKEYLSSVSHGRWSDWNTLTDVDSSLFGYIFKDREESIYKFYIKCHLEFKWKQTSRKSVWFSYFTNIKNITLTLNSNESISASLTEGAYPGGAVVLDTDSSKQSRIN